MRLIPIVFVLLFSVSQAVFCQTSDLTDNYKQAVSFLSENLNKKVFNLHIEPHWFPDSSGLWMVHQSKEGKKYLKISLPDGIKSELFDHQKLATALRDALGEPIKADDLPISNIQYINAGELVLRVKDKEYVLTPNTETYLLRPSDKQERSFQEEEIRSPDSKWIAYPHEYNLYLKSSETGEIRQLSSSGKKNYEYASWYGWDDIIEGENGERPKHFAVEWSKDSEWLYTTVCDLRTAQKMYLLDWSIDTLFRPKLLSYYRGSPGDTGMVYIEPVFFNVKTGKEIRPKLPRSTHINAIGVQWSASPGKVYLRNDSRGYQNVQLYSFDLATEKLQLLYTESSATNIDNFDYYIDEKNGLLFFLSEKSGWRQLYSLDLTTKKEQAITNGAFYINSIDRMDGANRRIFFRASGKEKDRNPYYQHLYSISFDGKDLKLLTKEDANHETSISPDGNYVVDNFSTVNVETTTVLRDATTGEILAELGKADVSELEGWSPPEIFTAIAHDGKTTIYGALWKPTNFDATKQYPIIDNSYTGPHTQLFPKTFRQAFANQALAELGFIVMRVDGLGSAGRSKEFHNYSYKNLGGGLKDHVGAIRQLGNRFQWIDTTRVGIFGHSAGGYDAAHALLEYPDFYKVAVASSADHDHRMEKAWWPEMYMGWPVDSAYHKQSNITMAGNLKGKLLIMHGGIDENVNPSATFKLAEALIRADKEFDMLILPSQRHGYTGAFAKYYTKSLWNYFVEHLLNMPPVWEFKWQ